MVAQKTRLKRVGVMLAHPAEQKHLDGLPKSIFVQPKLNGERCRVDWSDDRPRLLSSYGKEFVFLDRIKQALWEYPYVCFDGELYRHGWSREKVHSVVSRKTERHTDEDRVLFHVFDIVNEEKQYERIDTLERIEHNQSPLQLSPVTVVLTEHIRTRDLQEACLRHLANGFEGTIIRDPLGHYTPLDPAANAHRSRALLKVKPTKTDKYLIVGFLEEVDKEGFLKNALGALIVEDKSGNRFNVGTGSALTRAGRLRYWSVRDTLPGRWAVVKHSLITTVNGYPTCTSLVEII